jgi:hypothetical protein
VSSFYLFANRSNQHKPQTIGKMKFTLFKMTSFALAASALTLMTGNVAGGSVEVTGDESDVSGVHF